MENSNCQLKNNLVSDRELAGVIYAARHNLMFPEQYMNRVVEIIQHATAPCYRRVWQKLWNDSLISSMKVDYRFVDWQNKLIEFYVPTVQDAGGFMHYMRVVVKVYEVIDRETLRRDHEWLKKPIIKPMGFVDSEQIYFVAQKAEKGKILRGFKHGRYSYTYIIVNWEPEVAAERVLALLVNCLYKRYLKLLESLKVYPKEGKFLNVKVKEWINQKKETIIRILNFSLNNYESKLASFSLVIRRIFHSFIDTVRWLYDGLHLLRMEVLRVSGVLKEALERQIRQIREVYAGNNPFRRSSVNPPLIVKVLAVEAG